MEKVNVFGKMLENLKDEKFVSEVIKKHKNSREFKESLKNSLRKLEE